MRSASCLSSRSTAWSFPCRRRRRTRCRRLQSHRLGDDHFRPTITLLMSPTRFSSFFPLFSECEPCGARRLNCKLSYHHNHYYQLQQPQQQHQQHRGLLPERPACVSSARCHPRPTGGRFKLEPTRALLTTAAVVMAVTLGVPGGCSVPPSSAGGASSTTAAPAAGTVGDGGDDVPRNVYRASLLSQHLRMMPQTHLKFSDLQANLDRLPFDPVKFQASEILSRIFVSLSKKHREISKVLLEAVEHIRSIVLRSVTPFDLHPYFCCDIDSKELRPNPLFNTEVMLNVSCSPSRATAPSHDYTSVFTAVAEALPAARWQFFISRRNHIEYPAHAGGFCADVTRHRSVYARAVRPSSKRMVIILDHGRYMGLKQLDVGKAIARFLILSMNSLDRVAVIAVAGSVSLSYECQTSLQKADEETVRRSISFLDSIKLSEGATNYKKAFSVAFDLLRKTALDNGRGVVDSQILILAAGKILKLTDKNEILDLIHTKRQGLIRQRVIIDSYMLVDSKKSFVFAKDFLAAIAKSDGNFSPNRPYPFVLNSTDSLHFTAGRFTDSLTVPRKFPSMNYSAPWFDPISRQILITAYLPVKLYSSSPHTVPDAVFGIDLPLEYIVEDFNLPSPSPKQYAFMVNTETGHVLAHPLFNAASSAEAEFAPPLISTLEPALPPLRVFLHSQRTDLLFDETHKANSIRCSQRALEGTPFSVVVVDKVKNADDTSPALLLKKTVPWSEMRMRPFIYHRFDIMFPDFALLNGSRPHVRSSMCMHGNQISTIHAFGVFLSSAAFTSPFSFVAREETRDFIHNLSNYLFDDSDMIGNPGALKPYAKEEFRMLAYITKSWRIGKTFDFVVRRFVASVKGIILLQPAAPLPRRFDAASREWFTQATKFRGRVVATGPYLDAAGYGYVVTLSKALVRGDTVLAVAAMDISSVYLNKLIGDLFPECDAFLRNGREGSTYRKLAGYVSILETVKAQLGWQSTEQMTERLQSSPPLVSCLLMDHGGYVVSHPSYADPTFGQTFVSVLLPTPVEELHLVHKEPEVANELFSSRWFSKKSACVSPSDRKLQRTYSLTSMSPSTDLIRGVGNSCLRYEVSAVPLTNLFVGVVNKTCDSEKSFAPCGVNDRGCLNCRRFTHHEPECPCECDWPDVFNKHDEVRCKNVRLNWPHDELTQALLPSLVASATNSTGLTSGSGNGSSSSNSNMLQGGPPPERHYDLCEAPPRARRPSALSDSTGGIAVADRVVPAEKRILALLPSCYVSSCSLKTNPSSCSESIGCSWCTTNLARIPLETPFCTARVQCYSGIANGPSPYETFSYPRFREEMVPTPEVPSDNSALFGPVLAVALVMVVIFVLAKFTCRGQAVLAPYALQFGRPQPHVSLFPPSVLGSSLDGAGNGSRSGGGGSGDGDGAGCRSESESQLLQQDAVSSRSSNSSMRKTRQVVGASDSDDTDAFIVYDSPYHYGSGTPFYRPPLLRPPGTCTDSDVGYSSTITPIPEVAGPSPFAEFDGSAVSVSKAPSSESSKGTRDEPPRRRQLQAHIDGDDNCGTSRKKVVLDSDLLYRHLTPPLPLSSHPLLVRRSDTLSSANSQHQHQQQLQHASAGLLPRRPLDSNQLVKLNTSSSCLDAYSSGNVTRSLKPSATSSTISVWRQRQLLHKPHRQHRAGVVGTTMAEIHSGDETSTSTCSGSCGGGSSSSSSGFDSDRVTLRAGVVSGGCASAKRASGLRGDGRLSLVNMVSTTSSTSQVRTGLNENPYQSIMVCPSGNAFPANRMDTASDGVAVFKQQALAKAIAAELAEQLNVHSRRDSSAIESLLPVSIATVDALAVAAATAAATSVTDGEGSLSSPCSTELSVAFRQAGLEAGATTVTTDTQRLLDDGEEGCQNVAEAAPLLTSEPDPSHDTVCNQTVTFAQQTLTSQLL